jgi:transposase-like protein
MSQRCTFPAGFKAKVASEALSRAFTMAEFPTRHGVHLNMIPKRRHKAQECLPELFAGMADRSDGAKDAELKNLRAEIGKLTVENVFGP